MKIISNKRRQVWKTFLITTGILTFGLSIIHNLSTKGDFSPFLFLYFYINSIILFLMGMFLKYNKKNIYNILSVLLFISVTVGWFFEGVQISVAYGMLLHLLGGSLIIPLFHIAVIGSFISAIRRLLGKTKYEDELEVVEVK